MNRPAVSPFVAPARSLLRFFQAQRAKRLQLQRMSSRLAIVVMRFGLSLGLGLLTFQPVGPAPGALAEPLAPAVYTVDRSDDTIAAIACTDAVANDCSLRGAIIVANATMDLDTIIVPAGVYTLTVGPAGDDGALSGDLDITNDVTLVGAGALATIIDGNGGVLADRVFDIRSGADTTFATFSGVTIRNGGNSLGGLLNNSPSVLTVNSSIISGNIGAGIRNLSTVVLNMSTVSGNTLTGLTNINSGTATVSNSTLSGNSGQFGGGLFMDSGTVNLNNVTVTNNSATEAGGGLYRSGGAITLRNTLLAGNSLPATSPDCFGTITSADYNLVGNNNGCTFGQQSHDQVGAPGNTINPFLGPLLDNGGGTLTHALLASSPALDSGNETGCADQSGVPLTTDQRGTGRPQRGQCDIGGFELPMVQFASAAYSLDETVESVTLTATLDAVSAITISVNYATSNGSAVAGADYTTSSGALTFVPGQVEATVEVSILDDTLDELNETFTMALTSANGAALDTPATTTVTILDDDQPPEVQLTSSAYNVGEAIGQAVVTAALSTASGLTLTVEIATSPGTAEAGSDYSTANGTLIFSPGAITRTINITIANDDLYEASETIALALSNPQTVTLGAPGAATLTIADDDVPPQMRFSLGSYSVSEDGLFGAALVSLSEVSGITATVSYASSDGTALAGNDYTAVSGVLTFPPGLTTNAITVPVTADTRYELNETLSLLLSNPVSATLSTPNPATLNIVNDDPPPEVQFSASAFSADEDDVTAIVMVTLNTASGLTATVAYATSDGTATSGQDYVAGSGTLVFSPDQVARTVAITLTDDALYEPGETINLALSNPQTATLGAPNTGVLTIANDDAPPVMGFSSPSFNVIESAGSVVLTVTLEALSDVTATVTYSTTPGTATAGSDFTPIMGALTFPPGTTVTTCTVPILNDPDAEVEETFAVTLSNPQDATMGTATAQVMILNDDQAKLLLPLAMKNFVSYFEGPYEVEDNDSYLQANGPLRPGQAYFGYLDDLKDYFTFSPLIAGSITLTLDLGNNDDEGVQLQLFYESTSNRVGFDPDPPYLVECPSEDQPNCSGAAGTYYIYIANGFGIDSDSPYTLTVSYSTPP